MNTLSLRLLLLFAFFLNTGIRAMEEKKSGIPAIPFPRITKTETVEEETYTLTFDDSTHTITGTLKKETDYSYICNTQSNIKKDDTIVVTLLPHRYFDILHSLYELQSISEKQDVLDSTKQQPPY